MMNEIIASSAVTPIWHDISNWLWGLIIVTVPILYKWSAYSIQTEKKLLRKDNEEMIDSKLQPIKEELQKMARDIHEIKNSDKGTEGTNAEILEALKEIKGSLKIA